MTRLLVGLVWLLVAGTAAGAAEEVQFTAADGVRVFADVYRSGDGASAPVILLFHQAGGDARGEYTGIATRLLANGYNVVAVDLRSGGDRFGGVNRTLAHLERQDYGYCEVYPDLHAALDYTRHAGFDGPLAAWGSSYSAALVFELAARNAAQVNAVLAFSPASGAPLAACPLQHYLDVLAAPALALRPQSEADVESVQAQIRELAAYGVPTYIANPGVHGASMLDAARVGASTEATWSVVLQFLAESLRSDPQQPGATSDD